MPHVTIRTPLTIIILQNRRRIKQSCISGFSQIDIRYNTVPTVQYSSNGLTQGLSGYSIYFYLCTHIQHSKYKMSTNKLTFAHDPATPHNSFSLFNSSSTTHTSSHNLPEDDDDEWTSRFGPDVVTKAPVPFTQSQLSAKPEIKEEPLSQSFNASTYTSS